MGVWRIRAASRIAMAGLVVSGCGLAPPPQLVRDGAQLFTADARAAAESRLRALAAKYGVWTFVITDLEGDPPRMLDAPMHEADASGVRAVALLFGADRMVGSGQSRISFDRGDSQTLAPPDVSDLLAGGHADEALDTVVAYLESWVSSPSSPARPPPVVELGPSGTPAP